MTLDFNSLRRDGFCIFSLEGFSYLEKIQAVCERYHYLSPTLWHLEGKVEPAEHVKKVSGLLEALSGLDLFIDLLKANLDYFIPLLGPDINIQRVPHLRISRPEQESDFIDWHRDTFYGNTPWELNLWLPLYPLKEGSGLCIAPGSHLIPSENTRDITEQETFRKSVTKGSMANKMGYVYQPKTDNFLVNLKKPDTTLLAPKFGSAVLFFGCCAHRAQNSSEETRVTMDLRICNMHIKTTCKPGYYRALSRGIVQHAASKFLNQKDPP